MLMDIKCSAVTSVAVHLTFDDNHTKDALIALGDIIDVEYNRNGLRRRFQGKVIDIYAGGNDPKAWYIIVDGSDDFQSDQARFSPMSILDVAIIRKAETGKYIETPVDETGIKGLRILDGRLQYTKDGINWRFIKFSRRDLDIKDEEGTAPDFRPDLGIDAIKDEVS